MEIKPFEQIALTSCLKEDPDVFYKAVLAGYQELFELDEDLLPITHFSLGHLDMQVAFREVIDLLEIYILEYYFDATSIELIVDDEEKYMHYRDILEEYLMHDTEISDDILSTLVSNQYFVIDVFYAGLYGQQRYIQIHNSPLQGVW